MAPEPPSSILILGTGVFGLSMAHSLLKRTEFARSSLTVVSPEADVIPPSEKATTASVDTTRIIRTDYANPLYHSLGQEAQRCWQEQEWGKEGRYSRSGLLLTADSVSEAGDTHGPKYIAKSLQNVQETRGTQARVLGGRRDIAHAMRATGAACGTGETGYINDSSGWADAGASMAWLHMQVLALAQSHGNVQFVKGEAVRLLHQAHTSRVSGAELASGQMITADVTVLATGAWTPMLLDLRGIASCRAQTMAYFPVSSAEAKVLQNMPVHFNIGSGCFFFPPTRRKRVGEPTHKGCGCTEQNISDEHEWEIKVARHTFGYRNPVKISAPLGSPADESVITVSLPAPPSSQIPTADRKMLAKFLNASIPFLSQSTSGLEGASQKGERQSSWSRLCHYLDTPHGDFLVCFHPSFDKSLFLATGGSGHAFKFLPILGDKIVDVFQERWAASNEQHPHKQEQRRHASNLAKAWEWPTMRQTEDNLWCDDGSRSGEKGLVLHEAAT